MRAGRSDAHRAGIESEQDEAPPAAGADGASGGWIESSPGPTGRLREAVRLARHLHGARIRRQPVEPALEQVRHDETRRLRQRGIDARHRVAAKGLQLPQATFVVLKRARCRAAEIVAESVPHRTSALTR